jgi:hypothetical protein
MTTQMATVPGGALLPTDDAAKALESVVMGGDLSRMPAPERLAYYAEVCRSVGLNPVTQPFQYVTLQGGKMSLYATRNCTDQLRATREINMSIVSRETLGDTGVYVVTARATMPNGRTDESTGAINILGLKGESLANALMKAETKAKRRVTLSICGLSFADDSEVDSIPGARRVTFDTHTGEIQDDGPPTAIASTNLVSAPSAERAAAPDPDRAMKRVHAVGREKGLDHDDIKILAAGMMAERGGTLEHLADLGEKGLDGLSNYLDRTDAGTLAARLASYVAGGRTSPDGSRQATNGADATYNRETEADAKDVTETPAAGADAKKPRARKDAIRHSGSLQDVRVTECAECGGPVDINQAELSMEKWQRPVCAPCGVKLSAEAWKAAAPGAAPAGAEDPFADAPQPALAVA